MQNVHFISDCRILKSHMLLQSARSELMAMELVRSQTTIPVPRARKLYDGRHIEQGYGNGFVLMDRIPGATRLASRWPSLSLWQKIVVVLTMRNYLRQIRHVRSPAHALTPGPLGSGPQDCDGLQFGDHTDMPLERRMFDSSADLAGFYERWLRYFRLLVARGHVQGTPPPEPLPVGCFSPLVFTHNDLNMRNIIMDDTDTLWIIDWAWSGFYPPSFEYLAMRFAGQLDDAPADWQWAVRFMAEPAFDIEDWMISIGIRWDNW
jgi:aminoglycoside phosphotransferase (APT) family kinase protein